MTEPMSHEQNVMFDIAIIATSHQPDDAMFSISFKDLRRLNATIKGLESALSEARKSTRTPGTHERCNLCQAVVTADSYHCSAWEQFPLGCPIKAASADMGREDGDGC